MSAVAVLHPFIVERVRADGLLQLTHLFAPDASAVALVLLHAELLESAVGMRDERLSEARLEWWAQTLHDEPDRHPLTAGPLGAHLRQHSASRRALLGVLQDVPNWRTPPTIEALWEQALRLAGPLAAVQERDAATLAAHGLCCRLRQVGVSGPHNPGLCPLDLRARHQLAEAPAPLAWPDPLRRDWARAVAASVAVGAPPTARFDRVLQALLLRELAHVARPRWQPGRAGRGLGAVWRAWQVARR